MATLTAHPDRPLPPAPVNDAGAGLYRPPRRIVPRRAGPAGAPAYAAGLVVGCWSDLDDLRRNWSEGRRWHPHMDAAARDHHLHNWRTAGSRSLGWIEEEQ